MEYTNRVKLDEDGVYRWYHDVDMRTDRYMLNTMLKVLGIIGAFLLLMAVFMPSGAISKWKVAGILLAVYAVVVLITVAVYLIMMARRGGFYRYRYEMIPEGVLLHQEEADIKANQVLGTAALTAGTLAGHPVRAGISSMSIQAAANAGYTAFKSVRKIVVDEEKQCIFLKLLIGENLVYADQEDLRFVLEYIQSRVPEGCGIKNK